MYYTTNNLRDKVNFELKSRKISFRKAAKAIGVSPQKLVNKLSDNSKYPSEFSLRDITELCNYLQIDPKDFIWD